MRRSNAPSVRKAFIPLFKKPSVVPGAPSNPKDAAPKRSYLTPQGAPAASPVEAPVHGRDPGMLWTVGNEEADSSAGNLWTSGDGPGYRGGRSPTGKMWTTPRSEGCGRVKEEDEDEPAADPGAKGEYGSLTRLLGATSAAKGTPPTIVKRIPFALGCRPLHQTLGTNSSPSPFSCAKPSPGVLARHPVEVHKVEHAFEYYEVFYTKSSKKKHKNWEDGFVVRKGNSAELKVAPLTHMAA